MGDLVNGDDGLPAEEVGLWAKEKHQVLCRYIDMSRAARRKYIGGGGAAYIDLFCGPGRCQIRGTGEWIDGGAVAAWKTSVAGGAPFSSMIVADADPDRLAGTVKRLQDLGAPVTSKVGIAKETSTWAISRTPEYGLNFAFLDPYNLESLDFSIFGEFKRRKRLDIMVHLSKMDLQRNLAHNIAGVHKAFDAFAPGWRDNVNIDQQQGGIRTEVVEYWRDLVARTGTTASRDVRLLKGEKGQHLYWLLLLASHELAHKFWKDASNLEKQGTLF